VEINFLFDEDVTVDLVRFARERGYYASRHVNNAGLNGKDDIVVLDYAVENDLTLVTENARDFRRLLWRDPKHPGRHEIHPGLVLIEDGGLLAEEEIAWFAAFLDHIEGRDDLVNRIFEVHSPDRIEEFERPPLDSL